ncbi:hypothetical protein DFJ74DRAFT_730187 [Hyaloraphidium curvatum]|nr:hypothetical protein DFJ74DRAFT_730187 [Hyaloraphidium curvatum]
METGARVAVEAVRPDAVLCMQERLLWIKAACLACGRADAAVRRCAGCQTAPYCSKECQRAHWPAHREACQVLLYPLDFSWAAIVGMGDGLRAGFTHGPEISRSKTTTVCPTLNITCDAAGTPGSLLVTIANAEGELARRVLGGCESTGTAFAPNLFNLNAIWSSRTGLEMHLAMPDLPLVGTKEPHSDPRVLTPLRALLNGGGLLMLALMKDLGISAKIFYDIHTASTAMPALPMQLAECFTYQPTTSKVKRIAADGDVRPPWIPGSENWEFLHRFVPAAPVATPTALDPSNGDSPLFFRSTPPAGTYAPDAIESRVPTTSHHPGPFFALPGDAVAGFALCTALSEFAPNPLGLAAGMHAPFVQINAHTGGFRMLAADGWSFGTVPASRMANFVRGAGQRCTDCEGAEGPEGWRWPPRKNAISEERDRRFGVKACGTHNASSAK